jgi:hypothetical protein
MKKKGMVEHVEAHKVPPGTARSSKWPAVRRAHLKNHPRCEVCGGKKSLQAHHVRPFHLHPQLELDPKNLITLCESEADGCLAHLMFGHLGSFKSYNIHVREDVAIWRKKIKNRP